MKTRDWLKIGLLLMVMTVVTPVSAGVITTSGSAIGDDVSLAFDQTFTITANGEFRFIVFGPGLDAERDAVRFSSANNLSASINGVAVSLGFQDWNDSIPGFGGSVNGINYIFNDVGHNVTVGDTVRIYGAATGGSYIFGSGDAANYTVLDSGTYSVELWGRVGNVIGVESVPEPASLAIFGTICLVACGRRRKS